MLHIAGLMNDSGTLATQLEDTPSEVLGSNSSDNLTDHGGACKTDQVKFLLVQLHCNIDASFNAADEVFVQICVNQFLDDLA